MRSRAGGWAATAAAVLSLAPGCGAPDHTMTKAQAQARIESYLQETFRAAPPGGLALVRTPDETYEESPSDCGTEMFGAGTTGRIEPGVLYTASTRNVSRREIERFQAAVVAHWRARAARVERHGGGWRIYPGREGYWLAVAHYPSVHKLHVLGYLDQCIWPYGTPAPGP
ncbi:hypothetical protein [Sphaerisporangium krabiense]|uniref:Lipoprotein n=2 Tax=Sphaerisporangium krabiense TaxID=763782 RepID=A0A7W9DUV9_9ACTN|nr:hypothetical protein [Sphaerisporangium krabiense]MBB5630790.1 hypothetical protein [Sphaerisporangium krabiense]